MAQSPQDAPPADTPAQPAPSKKKRLSLGNVKKGLVRIGQGVKESVGKFVTETGDDIKNCESMEGLLTMATAEFESYIRQKADTTDKVDALKKIADSFKNAEGICFVASFNVALTVGGTYGRGIVIKRLSEGNWSLPLAIQQIEGNVGWQLNVSRSKSFYVLRNDQAIKNFQQKGNVKLGGKGFAAIGNLGIQAQGDVKASKESVTKSTGDASEVAATNASVGSVKGLALGVAVNAGTFQPCKDINEKTYGGFDIVKLFERGVNDAQPGQGDHYEAKSEDNLNKVKSDEVVKLTRELVRMMEGVIRLEKAEEEVLATAAAMRAQEAAAANAGK